LSASQLAGLSLTSQPSPYGSRLSSPGFFLTASLTSTISPVTGAGTGPTHFEDSMVATLCPLGTDRPAFFGVHDTMGPARLWATSLMPTVTGPSPDWRSQTCFSTR
jgi:hypothetical protein